MAFEQTPGQQNAVERLKALLVGGRLPHAFLFVGGTGTGRAATARELARVVLCGRAAGPAEHCGQCADCRLMQSEGHPDYYETGVPEGRQLVPIGTVRRMQEIAALKPTQAGRRVFVVRDAERMSLPAANSFLKTLEEPPGGCVFVLIASGLQNIPITIVSRCRVVRFSNLPPDALADRLAAEQMGAGQAHWLARRTWGSPGLARKFREKGLPEFNLELVSALGQLSLADNFRLSDWVYDWADKKSRSASEGRVLLQDLLECAVCYYRDLAVTAAGAGEGAGLFNADAADGIRRAVAEQAPEPFLDRADLALQAIERIGSNCNRRITLDHLFTALGRHAPPV